MPNATSGQIPMAHGDGTRTWQNLAGDATGSGLANTVTRVTGSGGSLPVLVGQTVLNSGGTHYTTSVEAAVTTSGTTPGVVYSFAVPASSSNGVTLSIVGQDQAGSGDTYSVDFSFRAVRASGVNSGNAQIIQNKAVTSSPVVCNTISYLAGSSAVVTCSLSTNTLNVNVTGITGLTMHWSCVGTIQTVS